MFGYVKAGPGITEIETASHNTSFFFFLEIKKDNLNCNNVKFNGASDKSLLTVCVDSML